MSSPALAIEAVALTKSYGRARGIVEVDLQVAIGEVVGLVGANGAGKSTLMRTMLDLIRPTDGRLRLLGLDSHTDSVAVRRRTAYLPGELVLPPRLTGYQALRRFSFARHTIEAGRVDQLADRLQLDLSRKVGDLSKGNKQKVGLVLAFAPVVDLLVLDEPTSGLDPLLQRQFGELVLESTERGATVLLSSHVMSEVEQTADRVVLMRAGRVVAVDDIATLRVKSRRRGVATPQQPADLGRLADLLRSTTGVSEVQLVGSAVTFASDGVVEPLLAALRGVPLASLDLTHADLEDAFFALYDEPPDEPAGPAATGSADRS